MGKKFIVPIVIIAALVLGVGGGYFAARGISARASAWLEQHQDQVSPDLDWDELLPEDFPFEGMPPGLRDNLDQSPWNGRNGMPIGPDFWGDDEIPYGRGMGQVQSFPASIEEATTAAQEYAAGVSEDIEVVRVMEFTNGYYALVMEKEGGKGAFGLYLRSNNSRASRMGSRYYMWNTKYTPAGVNADADPENAVSMADAAISAQDALDADGIKATVDEKGVDFYGYYTFTYLVDGEPAGLISVNGTTSQVWNYDWLGTYVAQQEVK